MCNGCKDVGDTAGRNLTVFKFRGIRCLKESISGFNSAML